MFKVRVKGKFFWSSYDVIAYWTESRIKGSKNEDVSIPPRLVLQVEKDKIVVISDICFKTWELTAPEFQEGKQDAVSSGRELQASKQAE